MKRIISARRTAYPGSTRHEEFIRGVDSTVKRKVIALIKGEPDVEYDLLIDDGGKKYIKKSTDLEGESLPIIDDKAIAEITQDGININISEGALPQQNTVNQLKKIRKATKGIDIGDRISNMNKQGANIQYIKNPIDTGIESFQDFEKQNKKFEPGWNFKNLQPFRSFPLPQTKSPLYKDRSAEFNSKRKKK